MEKSKTIDPAPEKFSDINHQLKQREAELSLINSVQEGIVNGMGMPEIYYLVGERVRVLFDAQVTFISIFNYENNTEIFHYGYESGELLDIDPRPIDKFRQHLIDTRETICINENVDEIWTEITGEVPTIVPGTDWTKSALYVPMIVGDVVRGYVSLQNVDRENAFSDSDVRMLSTLAKSMSIGLENARLFNETEQRNAELAVINSIQQGLVAEMDMQGIYDLVGDRIRELFDSQVTTIEYFDTGSGYMHTKYLYEDGERYFPDAEPINLTRQNIIKSGSYLLVNSNVTGFLTKSGETKPEPLKGTRMPLSFLFVPLKVGDEVKGVVTLQNLDHENAFSDSDVRLLSTLANSMSVALENARLFNETEKKNAELAVINKVQEGLVREMDTEGIYKTVGNKICEVLKSPTLIIRQFDHEQEMETIEFAIEDGKRLYGDPQPLNWANKHLIKTKESLLINKNYTATAVKYGGKGVTIGRPPKSAVFVPMIVGGVVKGSISLQNIQKENAFSDSDVRLLKTLTNSMSVALENARLFNETEQKNAELAVINSVQKGLVAEMNMQGIYDLVGDRIRDLFNSECTGIISFDHKNGKEEFNYVFEDGKRIYPEPRPIDRMRQNIIEDKKPLLISENAIEEMSRINGLPFKPVPETREAKSVLFVPMIVAEQVRGYVTLQNNDMEHAFNDSDVRLLNTLVNSMSVALENARLFNETEQRNAELAVINSVQKGLVAEMNMQGIYDLVGERIRDLFNSKCTGIVSFDHDSGNEEFNYVFEDGKRLYPNKRPIDKVRKKIIKEKKPILFSENALEEFSKINGIPFKPLPETRQAKSVLYVPMIVGNNVRGYVSLQNMDREHAFNDSDVRLLNTLVNSMSVALENARLFNETTRLLEETEQRATEMQTVNSISHALVSQLEFKSLIKLIGDKMRQTFNADIVYLALFDRQRKMLDFPYMYGDQAESRTFGNGITEKIILSREPLLINQDLEKTFEKIEAERTGKLVESFLGVPVIAGKEAIGVISVQSTQLKNRFNENDLRLLKTIAANVGVAMQNAEAYRKLHTAIADLQAVQEQLIQQEKLASLGQLTAGIAHEIKNPLNFVNNFSELNIELLDEVVEEVGKLGNSKATEEVRQMLSDIRENLRKVHQHGTRADSIVKSMLQHSRGGSGKMEQTDFNYLVKEFVNLSFHGMRSGKKAINVIIDLQLDEKVETIPLISEDFSRVVVNLCNNAFDAMWDKTKATDRDPDYKPKLTVRTHCSSENIELEIQDNGMGVPKNLQDKILQPFFTTKKGTQGTGLGLSITGDIIKAHKGKLALESAPGKGTCFKISIPYKQDSLKNKKA